MKKIFDYLSDMLKGNNRKKLVENSAIIIIIGIIIIIAGGAFGGNVNQKQEEELPDKQPDIETSSKLINTEDKAEVEKKVEEILSQIDGAGKVNVMITYVSGKEMVPAYDTKKTENGTDEKDTGGGTRNIRQSDYEGKVVYEEGQGGFKKPIILKEIQPVVKGVVVVSDGAAEPRVKDSLSKAVQVLLDVPIHRIEVFERKK